MEYRVSFEVATPLSVEELSTGFYELFDGTLAEREGCVTVSVIGEAEDGFEFGVAVLRALETKLGVSVIRLDLDIVDIPEIAERLEVSRQAVAKWATGTRGCGFPRVIGAPGGKRLWTWGQITEWASRTGRLQDEPLSLTQDEVARIDAYLAERRRSVTTRSSFLKVREGGQKAGVHAAGPADYDRSNFAMGA